MIEAVGAKVLKLVRTAIGTVRIGDLPIGKWRELTPEELRAFGVQVQGRSESECQRKPIMGPSTVPCIQNSLFGDVRKWKPRAPKRSS
jgi:hypothetical protein